MFQRCLRSIVEVQTYFDLIFISLNGDMAAVDLAAIHATGLEMSRVEVIRTKRLLAPARHGAWAAFRMRTLVAKDAHVVLLAHDDEIVAEGLDHWVRTRPLDWNLRTWIGDYLVIDDTRPEVPARRVAAIPNSAPSSLGLVEWLAVNSADPRRYVYTNMSGISVPLSTLLRVARFMRATRMTKGARYEYMLAASRTNVSIDRRSRPIGIIHEHPNQEGKSVPVSKQQMDEARYCLWLLINAKSFAEFQIVLRSYWGLSRLSRSFFKAINGSFRSRLQILLLRVARNRKHSEI